MKSVLLATAIFAWITIPVAADDQSLMKDAKSHFKPIPSLVPAVKDNAVTHDKVELGKMLFFDPRLSASHLISCNTCHNMSMGGDDNLETSIGHGWAKGPRNAPTVLNAVFNIAQFWDGRASDLKTQAKGPIQAGVEMNNTPKVVEETLLSIPTYVAKFKSAFPNEAQPVTFDNLARAIEAFEATLITPASRFDQFLEGKLDALDATEKTGLRLFVDKGCVACHSGVNVGGEAYYPFGVVEKPGADILPAKDRGRFEVTKTADADYVFRAGPLRNIALTAPYFHSGKVWDLKQAVAIMATSQLGTKLNDPEIEAITAFLCSLTGEQPRVELPILPVSTTKTPLPK
ncbi:cytochrome-c peroxidase [Blastochloris viridis]|uniref:Cytochrome c551 peroxidase n=1 Tax=Blastochloris viridis TaxID=1079 RepID=A0A0H5BAL9_BLAVI|nr:Cytochrome c551 peroxidase precursor [Blastochloris viridis]BAR98104.1 cytochrome c551 peroxidase [Blastochloris viridis]CUU41270.1 Cytochrome c551 peroxidase precursor [Blastochloris viridis]